MFSLLLKDLIFLLLPSIFLLLRHVYNHLCKKILWTSHDHRHPLRDCITSSTSNISSNLYLKRLRALSRNLISLTNELAPTYRARHPHGPSASFPYVPTYGVEYLQGASAPFSCFYDTLVLMRTVLVVNAVNMNFLPVAERNKLLILLAVPAVLAVIYT